MSDEKFALSKQTGTISDLLMKNTDEFLDLFLRSGGRVSGKVKSVYQGLVYLEEGGGSFRDHILLVENIVGLSKIVRSFDNP